MDNLFRERRQQHFLMLLKYWRLVFNDHFVIALFFLFGALSYGYAQVLPSIPANNLWIKILLIIGLVIITQLGRFATLVKRADPVFLLPQSSRMTSYFWQAFWYSCIFGVLITFCGVLIALPLAMVTMRITTKMIVVLLITAMLIKVSWLNIARLQVTTRFSSLKILSYLQWLIPLLIWSGTWLINPMLGLVLGIADVAITAWLVFRYHETNWRVVVKVEQDRMATVYRFFNLFTDVPTLQGQIKKRTYLRPLLRWLREDSVWHFLYGRGLVRNTEIGNLALRLTLVLAAILLFVPVLWLNSIIMALGLYLVAVQLIPLYDQFANNAFIYVYPISQVEQDRDFRDIIRKIMILVAVVMVIASIGVQGNILQVIINAIIAAVEIPLLSTRYLQSQLKKIKK
ncbi:ABC transporter permease [uncultured Limosilactobacillus sp.]|uniref:ABC transporter permease n=1 Tax=uncultured Limosilactobacillus sp. TaxID=2837629 RepID=UPI0025F23AF9|nr:ABC transporter permease [uncultured Limosilactobacillus sp.]